MSEENGMSPRTFKRRIVIGMDGSQNAKDAFLWYAKKMHQPEDYVIVVHSPEFKNLAHMPVMTSDAALMTKIVDEEQQQTKVCLTHLSEMLKLNGVQGTVKHIPGEPGEQIVHAAQKEGADFIVTGSRGMGKLRRTFLGSVSDYIVHHSPVPVLVCRLEDSLH
ncbi:NHAX-like protein [Mya arenaria]|uniref:NHAX-like protein n=1 Tax=Mya arenaria TaxID=6604 RepID=A0ABY7FX75_MYAAR|nr:stress response protein NhaX-like [Mya arenaria]WAR25441.1 NHAX-like protein [Mya arenaria]